MPKYRIIDHGPLFSETCIQPYVGTYLCEVIHRARENGVPPSVNSQQDYDDDAEAEGDNLSPHDQVDPNCDIKTDRFSVAEHMAMDHARAAAQQFQAMRDAQTSAAASAAVNTPAEGGTPSADSTPSPAGAPEQIPSVIMAPGQPSHGAKAGWAVNN